ncbi:hypothetical protein BDN72DRAFT_760124 [Pluteus cervinus]|uniref:Uncharacterized protein n=1 Tax=Pluteus cervinus TaxID=181527 RepID=A0ACD3B7J7_9AGAR|nr:hypothetical protein BDN72DRAFT_760124 [Pluteus cervinus]
MARRLGAELWADISKVNAAREAASAATNGSLDAQMSATTSLGASAPIPHVSGTAGATFSAKEAAALATMRIILSCLEKDALARSTLMSTVVPEANGDNVFNLLRAAVNSGSITKQSATPLSQILVSLARSEALFGILRNTHAPSVQLELGKRKRVDGGDDARAYKRPYLPATGLQQQLTEAVHIITQALGTAPTGNLDPTLVTSIRLQLHQVFLFAVTSSAGGGPEMNALQEISGLIQVIGVLSGIQIGQNSDPQSGQPLVNPGSAPWPIPPGPDIGTAVYPCLVPNCRKTFSRLYNLRAHQRVHATHRPFRCHSCPASFARNHDLKRHLKLHDKTAWKCGGCQKVFSRRDAIKRHKDGNKARGLRNETCADAEVVEVQLDDEEREDLAVREERRAKLWNGITVNEANAALANSTHRGFGDDGAPEEGELQPSVINTIQVTILSLHGLLQAHVGHVLGTGQPGPPPLDPSVGQATLASVIARAQMLNMPPTVPASSAAALPLSNDNSLGSDPTNFTINSDNVVPASMSSGSSLLPSLSLYGLSDEQTKLLEEAIASAASAAQAQAEAEAALEEEEGDFDFEEDEGCGNDDLEPSNVEAAQ